MNLKFITQLAPGISGPDYHHFFGDVSNYTVTDYWSDLGTDSHQEEQVTGEKNLINTPSGDSYTHIHIGYNQPGVGTNTKRTQQQFLVISFDCGSKKYAVTTAMPVYVMNESGGTIQKYVPATK